MMNRLSIEPDRFFVVFVKGTEKYTFTFPLSDCTEFFLTLCQFASNPELSFTWYDAAVLSKRVRGIMELSETQH
jgi:hypothetical protein